MHCVSVCMSEAECKSEVQIKIFLGPFGAGHDTTCIKECIRAIDHVSILRVTNSMLRTPHASETKFQSARVLGLVIVQPRIHVGDQGRSDSGHCSLAAMWSKDPGQARNGRRFRIDAWLLTPVPANIPLYVQLRLARIVSQIARRTPRRGHNENMHKASDGNQRVRAAASKSPPPPAGEVVSTRDQVAAPKRNRPGLTATLNKPFQL